jgi:hypothetical protein
MRLVVLGEQQFAGEGLELAADHRAGEQLLAEPHRHGRQELAQPTRRDGQILLEEALELEERDANQQKKNEEKKEQEKRPYLFIMK